MTDNDPKRGTAPTLRPRSPRVPVEFALGVAGKTLAGASFKTEAKAIKISRGGATILLDAEVAIGSVVTLTPPFGRDLNAEVNGIWSDPIDGHRRIGVKLLEADGWFAD